MDLKTKIGKRIAKAREKAGFNQTILANMLNMTRSNLVNIEKGRQSINVTKIIEISRLTGYSVSSIIDDRGENLEPETNRKLNISEKTLSEIDKIPEKHLKRFLTFYNQIKGGDYD
jgi:transcriptional regulator with XRE-family HTH domain